MKSAPHILSGILGLGMVILGGLTAVLFVIPNLVTISLLFLILPGLVLLLIPSLFAYWAVFSAAWFSIHRWNVPAALIAACGSLWLFGRALPDQLNRQTVGWLAEARAQIVEPQAALPKGASVVALETSTKSRPACDDLCASLLYNGDAQRVIVRTAGQALAYRIDAAAACQLELRHANSIARQAWLSPEIAHATAEAVRVRMASGDCLLAVPAGELRADLTLRRLRRQVGPDNARLSLRAGGISVEGVEALVGDQLAFRLLTLRGGLLKTPLQLEPYGSGIDYRGWQWARAGRQPEPIKIEEVLEKWTSFRLEPPPGATALRVRTRLDALLADLTRPATDAAFSLLPDYARHIEKDPEPDDGPRLARLIADRRVEPALLVHVTRKHASLIAPVRDALLARLSGLAAEGRFRDYELLERQVEYLPPRAFASVTTTLDQLLASDETRRHSPQLVYRLAERDPSAVGTLLAVVRDSPNFQTPAHAALLGLCRLGPAAQSALAPLQAMAASGHIPAQVTEGQTWQATLVALGADAASFPPPRRQEAAAYHRRLRETAQRGCGTP